MSLVAFLSPILCENKMFQNMCHYSDYAPEVILQIYKAAMTEAKRTRKGERQMMLALYLQYRFERDYGAILVA
jgi:hypothetical protein